MRVAPQACLLPGGGSLTFQTLFFLVGLFLLGRYASCASIGIPEVPYNGLARWQNAVDMHVHEFASSNTLTGLFVIAIINYRILRSQKTLTSLLGIYARVVCKRAVGAVLSAPIIAVTGEENGLSVPLSSPSPGLLVSWKRTPGLPPALPGPHV